MNPQVIKELATKLNNKINIPFLPEAIEQNFFEFIVKTFFDILGEYVNEKVSEQTKLLRK